ncbi:hypothetical protein PSOLA_01460 [Candidatus Phytoplasma solani]|uniref:Uncharacterized protein n=2 Tax=Candidatus Phytoplasma solani TaxID=69896 RepID=A0A421NYF3_9MOLU|nr:hypothetical protein PSSA1_v1c1580 [Candidatus Phytoplasma solani]RMI88960.1 hypothetical protein PSSA1_v1c1650 [Candidatus Phytoplasma solani]
MQNFSNPNLPPKKEKSYFVTLFWITFVLSFISRISIYLSIIYFLLFFFNEYKIFEKTGKIAHHLYNQNHKCFLNKWFISISLKLGFIIFIFLKNFNSQIIGLLVILGIISYIISFFIDIINKGSMYQFLDKLEKDQQVIPNNFYSRFIWTLVLGFVSFLVIIFPLFSLISKLQIDLKIIDKTNLDISKIQDILSYAGLNILLGVFLASILFFIAYILNLINLYKVCYKMDNLEIS